MGAETENPTLLRNLKWIRRVKVNQDTLEAYQLVYDSEMVNCENRKKFVWERTTGRFLHIQIGSQT